MTDDGQVRLRRLDGQEFGIPLDRISEADQAHVRQLLAAQPPAAEPSPFEPVEAQPTGSSGLVVVSVHVGQTTFYAEGWVISREGGQSLILCTLASLPRDINLDDDTRYAIVGDSGTGKSVGAEVLAAVGTNKIVLTVPSSATPGPALAPVEAAVEDGTAVEVVALEIQNTRAPPTVNVFRLPGTTRRVAVSHEGVLTGAIVIGQARQTWTRGMVLTESGRFLGLVEDGRMHPLQQGGARSPIVDLLPPPDPKSLLDMALSRAYVAPKAGDRDRIDWEFVIEVYDPLGQLKEPTLLMKGLDYQLAERNPPTDGKTEPIEDARTLSLRRVEPDEAVARQGLEMLGRATFPPTTYVAEFSDVNPGPNSQSGLIVRTQFQLTYLNEAGQRIVLPSKNVNYSSGRLIDRARAFKRESVVPDVPGLDGHPLDQPVPRARPDGGILLTSEVTRVTAPEREPATTFPQPIQGSESVAGEPKLVGSFQVTPVAVRAFGGGGERHDLPFVFSPNGEFFFVVDGKGILHKIRTQSLSSELRLKVGFYCSSVAYSEAGLVLALQDQGAVWVVDPDTLQVKREIPIEGVECVTATPNTSIGFASGTLKTRTGSLASEKRVSRLHMLDLVAGRALHSLQSTYDFGRKFRIDDVQLLDDVKAIQMSQDGRWLYTGWNRIQKFGVEPESLTYVESARATIDHVKAHMTLSGDGRWLAVPVAPGVGSRTNGISVYSTNDLSKPATVIDPDNSPWGIGWDTAKGNVYSVSEKSLNIFNEAGTRVGGNPIEISEPRRLFVNPRGDQFVIWGRSDIHFYKVAE